MVDILYHGEIQILGWGESRNRGKYLTIRLWEGDDDPLGPFRGLDEKEKGMHILNATISRGDILQNEPEDFGKMATKLYRNGFFYAPKVLESIGSDKQYREWIQKQPSVFSGQFSEYVNGEGRNIAAHVRRSNESGTSYKAEYSCIPLTNAEHQLQHQKGEESLKPRDWFVRMKNELLIKWAKETLLKELGNYSGFKEVPPDIIREWARQHSCFNYLPSEYRE